MVLLLFIAIWQQVSNLPQVNALCVEAHDKKKMLTISSLTVYVLTAGLSSQTHVRILAGTELEPKLIFAEHALT